MQMLSGFAGKYFHSSLIKSWLNRFLERDFQGEAGADLQDKNHRKPLQFKGRRQEMIFGDLSKTAGYCQKER
jgi:hypothetical protein